MAWVAVVQTLLLIFLLGGCKGGGSSQDVSPPAQDLKSPLYTTSRFFVGVAGNSIPEIRGEGATSPTCFQIDPLPAGLSLSSSCTISGNPTTVLDMTSFKVGYLNGAGAQETTINIQVDKGWKRISGSVLLNRSPSFGTKGVGSSSNTPGARRQAATWKDASGNLWLFGGIAYLSGSATRMSDLWKFDGTNWIWVHGPSTGNERAIGGTKGVPNSANVPASRWDAQSWVDNSGNFWLYGGYGSDPNPVYGAGYLADLWKFDGTNWTWVGGTLDTWLGPGGGVVYGTKGAADPSNTPGSRAGGMTWTDVTGNLWLYGGYTLSDLWKFDGSNWTWISGVSTLNAPANYGSIGVSNSANHPGNRTRSAVWTSDSGDLYLFGGVSNEYSSNILTGVTLHNDLWKFDGTNWTWLAGSNTANSMGSSGTKGQSAPSNIPSARGYSAHWKDSTGNVWLYGGVARGFDVDAQDEAFDLWKFDGTNWTWMSGHRFTGAYLAASPPLLLGPNGQASSHPSDLRWSQFWHHNDKLFLYSGFGTGTSTFSYGLVDSFLMLELP